MVTGFCLVRQNGVAVLNSVAGGNILPTMPPYAFAEC